MYERFSDRARRVMVLAQQEAQRWNHEYVGPEHILVGLLREGNGVAAAILTKLGVIMAVQPAVEKLMQSGPNMIFMGKLPQTPRAKRVIEFAIEEARTRENGWVGTEHLLIGLLREEEGIAGTALAKLGVTLERVRAELDQMLRRGPTETGAPEGPVAGSMLEEFSRAYDAAPDLAISVEPRGGGIYRITFPNSFRGWLGLGEKLSFIADHRRVTSLLVFTEEREAEK